MSDHRDHKAEFGHQPTWDEQRRKQEQIAENFYGEAEELSPEEIREMGE